MFLRSSMLEPEYCEGPTNPQEQTATDVIADVQNVNPIPKYNDLE